MKRIVLLTIVLVMISILFSGCFSEKRRTLSQEEFRKYELEVMELSFNSDVKIIENTDKHDDFLGDGYTYTVYELTDEQVDEIAKQTKESIYWSEVKKNQEIFLSDIDAKTPSPKEVANGYVFLKGRTQEAETKEEIELMKTDGIQYGSYCYAVVDITKKRLYYYQFDS